MLRKALLVFLVLVVLATSGCCSCLTSGLNGSDNQNGNANSPSGGDGQSAATGDNADLVGDWSDSTSGHTEYTVGDWEYTKYSALGRMVIFDKNGQFNDIVRFENAYGGFENVQLGDYRVRGDTITFSNVQVKSTDSLDNPVWSTKDRADYTATYAITNQGDTYELDLAWSDGNTTTLYKSK